MGNRGGIMAGWRLALSEQLDAELGMLSAQLEHAELDALTAQQGAFMQRAAGRALHAPGSAWRAGSFARSSARCLVQPASSETLLAASWAHGAAR